MNKWDYRGLYDKIGYGFQLLSREGEPASGAEIIVVSQELNLGDQLEKIKEEVIRSEVTLHAIVFPESSFREIQELSRITGGKVFTLSRTEPATSMVEILNAYESIIPLNNIITV